MAEDIRFQQRFRDYRKALECHELPAYFEANMQRVGCSLWTQP